LTTHSLWLVPDRSGPVFVRLCSLIEALARRFNTPMFDPHVTLLGGLERPFDEVRAIGEAFAPGVEPYVIRLGNIVSNGIYFQRLIALASPTATVLGAHERAKAAFGAKAMPYLPHLSLAYGELEEAQTAQLQATAVAAGVVGTTFSTPSLEVWRTDGPVASWERAGVFTLGMTRGR
jgi:hypothetical protein